MSTLTPSTPTSAAIYCRISDDRAGLGLGVDRQERLCRELAERKMWPVGAVFTDNSISASSGKKRPRYEALLEALADGAHDGLLCVDVDRLTRTPSELETLISLCDRLGVAMANVSGDFDLATSDGRLRARLLGAVARAEIEKKSERQTRANEDAARRGVHVSRRATFGWRRSSPLEQEPSEAALIRDAVERVLDGESVRSLVLELNAAGILTSRGSTWDVTALRTALANPRHAGLQVYRGEVIGEGAWEPIIDRESHQRLTAMVNRRRKPGRPRRHLLSGIARCGRCEAPMCGTVANSAPGYTCPPPPLGCGRIAVKAEPFEEFIVEAVLTHLDSLDIPALDRGEGAGLVAEVEADREMLTQLAELHATRRIGMAEWLTARDAVEARITTNEGHLDRIQAPTLPADPRAVWPTATIDQKRAILSAVLERIVVHPAASRARRPVEERISAIWSI